MTDKEEHLIDEGQEEILNIIKQCEEDIEYYECPNCGYEVIEQEQELLYEPWNTDEVCDYCIRELDYYG